MNVFAGILNVKSHCVVGNGVVVHLRGLLNELKTLREADIDYKGDDKSDSFHIICFFILSDFSSFTSLFVIVIVIVIVIDIDIE